MTIEISKPDAQGQSSFKSINDHPVIVFAINEAYAMPLATTMRSIVENNTDLCPFDFRVLIEYIPAEIRDKVEKSLPPEAATIRWIQINLGELGSAHPPEYASGIINARLLIPLLITDVERVLYFDADTLVLGDVEPLWSLDLSGAPIGAVVDGMNSFLQANDPSVFDLPRVRKYFNSGVLVIDVHAWKRLGVTERAVDYIRRFPRSRHPDQDALNWTFDGAWKEIDWRWNCQAHLNYHDVSVMQNKDKPYILHFVTSGKPWNAWVQNANSKLYDSVRDRTLFIRTTQDRIRDSLIVIARYFKLIIKGTWPGLMIHGRARQRSRLSRRAG